MSLIEIRDAVCHCINTEVQSILVERGIEFTIGLDAVPSPNAAKAFCVYRPSYNTSKDNKPKIYVFGRARRLLLEESIGQTRGHEKIQSIVSEYSVTVEMIQRLCGSDAESDDAYPLDKADTAQQVFESIEDLLMSRRQIVVDGVKYYMAEDGTEPFSVGYDPERYSQGLFEESTTFTYRMSKCPQ